jgi:hypothetical protein
MELLCNRDIGQRVYVRKAMTKRRVRFVLIDI